MSMIAEPFGVVDGRTVKRFTLRGAQDIEAQIITYGGTLVSQRAPDRHGRSGDVVLGFNTLPPYLHNPAYIGRIVGRFANRIADGVYRHTTVFRLATLDGADR